MFDQFKSDCRRWTYGTILTRWLALSLGYCLVRWAVVEGVDPNEDFNCIRCSKPVLERRLYCSVYCEVKDYHRGRRGGEA